MHLTATECNLLAELSVHAGRVFPYDDLLQRVWGVNHSGTPGVVRTQPTRLRRRLGEGGENPMCIFAEARVGYRMPVGEGQGQRVLQQI